MAAPATTTPVDLSIFAAEKAGFNGISIRSFTCTIEDTTPTHQNMAEKCLTGFA